MTLDELVAAFEKIHPSHRTLTFVTPSGKTHWSTLNTVPPQGSTDLSIPLVHLERGHGSADALGEFFVAALRFVREQVRQ